MTAPVSFVDVGLSYGNVTALAGLSAEFNPGLNVVLGPNGAGKHNTQIAPSLIDRKAAEAGVLLGDKGQDDQQIRALARENDIRPLIKHREFSSLQKAWNALLDTELYG